MVKAIQKAEYEVVHPLPLFPNFTFHFSLTIVFVIVLRILSDPHFFNTLIQIRIYIFGIGRTWKDMVTLDLVKKYIHKYKYAQNDIVNLKTCPP